MDVGHKRSLTSVMKLLKEEFNVDVDELWKRICKIINLTFISA